jgi:hypothetical protein
VTLPSRVPPFARRVHPLEAAQFARKGAHCDTRSCREPAAVYAWYLRRAGGRVIGHERFLCAAHGKTFAARHHLDIEPAPAASELGLPRPEPRLGVHLEGMSATLLAEHEIRGWHCDHPRCRQPARYLSSRRYRARTGRYWYLARFLCASHARRFAARHDIDFTAVLPPEGDPR